MSERDKSTDLSGRPAPPARAIPEFAPPPPPEEREPEYVELDFAEEPEGGGLAAKFGLKRRERPPEVELPPRARDPFSERPPEEEAYEEPALPVAEEAEADAAEGIVESAVEDDVADEAGDEAEEAAASPPSVSEFSMRREPSEEHVLVGDIESARAELPEPEPDPFAEQDYVEPLRPAPPEVIDATATVDERTGEAWERQVAPPAVADASAPPKKEKKAKPEKAANKGSLLGKLGIKKIESTPVVEDVAVVAVCPLHDVPLSSPLIFNENTGARYPAGTTHAVCIGVLPAPTPVADEHLAPVPGERMKRPKRTKKEKPPKPEKPEKAAKPEKAKRPSRLERRAAAKEQKRAGEQDELLGALIDGEQKERKLSRRERRQQEKRRRQLDASERQAQEARAEEERQAVLAPEVSEPDVGLPMAPASLPPTAPTELDAWPEPAEAFAEEKKAKKAKQPKSAKPRKPAKEKKQKKQKEKRSLLGLLGIRKIEKEESEEPALSPWEPERFTPPVVESVAEEPPPRSFPPLVIDAEEDEPAPLQLPQLRRPHSLPPVEPDPALQEPVDSLVFDASRPDEEIARAQEKSQRRRGWSSRRERQPKIDKADQSAPVMASSEWRQRVLAREARPFLLLLLTAFLLLIGMWVLAVRSSADAEVAAQTQATTELGAPADVPPPGEAEVPAVVGQPLEAARLVLDASAFEIAVKQSQSDRPEGEIVSQDPAPGTTVPAASVVTVTVSGGQGQVPNVVGQQIDVASGRIEGAGFEAERRARVDRGHVGEVVEQQPRAGTRAGKGSVVVVFFGRAPAAAPLPSVVGQTQSEARAALAEKGYGVRIRYAYGDQPTGEVIKSAPAAGQKLAGGDIVTLTVSLGPRTTSTTPTAPATRRNGDVAYVAVTAGKGEIYLAKPDGSGRRNLSANPADDRNPTFAPTGLQLAFQSDRAGNFDIYSRPTSGQGLRRLTTAANDEREPAWSPLGQRIAYVSKEGDFYALYTMATDGTGKTKVLGGQRSWRTPSWSPDGQRLLVAGGNADDYNIFVVSASGGAPRQVAGVADYDVDPVFSPNGLRVLFSSNRDGDYDLYSVALAGGAATRLTAAAGDDMNPSYSPDGKRIVFQSTRAGAAAVYHMPAGGGSAQRVAPGIAPAWQPGS